MNVFPFLSSHGWEVCDSRFIVSLEADAASGYSSSPCSGWVDCTLDKNLDRLWTSLDCVIGCRDGFTWHLALSMCVAVMSPTERPRGHLQCLWEALPVNYG